MKNLIYRQNGKDGFYKIWHTPENNIFIFIHRGDGSIVLRDKSYPLVSGALYFIGADKNHYTFPDKTERYQRSKLFLDSRALEMLAKALELNEDLSRMFQRESFAMALLSEGDAERVSELLESLSCLDERDELFKAKLNSAAARLMILISENATEKTKSDPDTLQRAIEYIHRHIADDLTVEVIAASCYISKYYLCRLFKKRMGITIMDYVLQTRIVMAKELLADGKSSVTHTCMTCGFGNPSYFSRVFKEKTGLSPIKYKKQRGKVN